MSCFCFGTNANENKNKKRYKIGILRIDYEYPPIAGDVDDERSFDFGVEYEVVEGLTFQNAQQGILSAEIISSFKTAIRKLEKKNVIGLSGDCGFMMAYQKLVCDISKLPVFMSSLLQTPIIAASIEDHETIGILSANSDTLKPNLKKLMTECGVNVNLEQIYVIGCQEIPGFDAVAKGEKVNNKLVNKGIEKIIKHSLVGHPNTKAFLMECTELPCYSDTVRYISGLPVFDIITLINLFYASSTDNPNFGINGWDI
tara:strand:- start:887 stop:1657 length:771 start_codon:yes stop_codon:yes gene_type:complete